MRILWVVLIGLGACSPEERVGVMPDAEVSPDAEPCIETVQYVWSDLDASAPSGSLATFHYAYAFYETCGYYHVIFREQPQCAAPRGAELSLVFISQLPPTPGEVIPAYVSLSRTTREDAPHATFTVASFQEDYQHPSFAGRFAVTTPGWQLDINIEMTAQYGRSCTLL